MFNLSNFIQATRYTLYWSLLAGLCAIPVAFVGTFFALLLNQATNFRIANPAIIVFLPIVGFGIVWLYLRFGANANQGNPLIIEELHSNQGRVPFRMTWFILFGTVFTHLFGGSSGREGAAVQIGGSIVDTLGRYLRLNREDRRLLLMSGVSAGFGAVFGTPIAAFVFGMEVQSMGRIRYDGLVPCLVAAIVGDLVARAIGISHTHYPHLTEITLEPVLLIKVVLASVLFGFTARFFIFAVDTTKALQQKYVAYAPYRAVIGGIVLIILTVLIGNQQYNGLSTPLILSSLNDESVFAWAFALKILFTVVTLGSGYVGGEVMPLFAIGATLGATLAPILGIEQGMLASLGLIALLGSASNTPIACTFLGVELFGAGALPYMMVACGIAYIASGHRSIYSTQRIATAKYNTNIEPDESVHAYTEKT
jgi:H+/Cl- antiporter ClcA